MLSDLCSWSPMSLVSEETRVVMCSLCVVTEIPTSVIPLVLLSERAAGGGGLNEPVCLRKEEGRDGARRRVI